MNDIVVYTAVVGDNEYPTTHQMHPDVDYIYFTNGQSKPPDGWQVHLLKDLNHRDNRRVAKLPKCAPFLFDDLQKYKYAIWIDGDMEILKADFPFELLSYLESGLLLSPHFDGRHCAYGEATIRPAKYHNEPMDEQVAYYEADGFPLNFGLYEAGVLAWDMTNTQARELAFMWCLQNYLFSYQDQISLPYCLWKTGFIPSILPKSFRHYKWVHINAHKTEA